MYTCTSPRPQVLEYLTTPDEEFITEERQQAFIELLDSGALSGIDEDRLLAMAEKAKLLVEFCCTHHLLLNLGLVCVCMCVCVCVCACVCVCVCVCVCQQRRRFVSALVFVAFLVFVAIVSVRDSTKRRDILPKSSPAIGGTQEERYMNTLEQEGSPNTHRDSPRAR